MAFDTKTFLTRTASAAVFVVLLLGCVWYSYISFILFFSIVGFIGLHEFYNLSTKLNVKPHRITGYLLHIVTIATIFSIQLIFSNRLPWYLPTLIIVICFFLYVIELFNNTPSLSNIAYTILAWFHVSLPCFLLILMAEDNAQVIFQPQKVLGIIFFIWINDTGAYLVGSFLGKHKLYERISPNKTWEGTIGGIILCIALSFVIAQIFPQLPQIHWTIISVIVAVFGTFGDLIESMQKRLAGVKDSGKIMPGHGGVLDRFDSLFFSTPFVFCYLAATGNL